MRNPHHPLILRRHLRAEQKRLRLGDGGWAGAQEHKPLPWWRRWLMRWWL